MSSNFLAELSNDYKKLFETEIGYDVIIYAGEEPNVKEIHAHSNILCVRSQYFRTAFSNEWAKKEDDKFILRKQNIKPQLFDIILRFIYCGTIELKNLQGPDVLNLLIAVDELNIHSLITYIQEYLIDHQTEFLHQNPTGVLEIVYQHETFTDLWNFCLEKICKEPKILFDSNNFTNLKAPLLELLLKRDDLNMDEIEIWNSLLKWFFTQQNMLNDPTKWGKDDITKIERSLHRFIPLIRFYDIEPTEFFYNVYCYKDILPQDLIHDLLEYHIVPNKKLKANKPPSRKPNLKFKLDSNLIKSNHVPLFASWIDKKESSYYDKKNIPYEFKLLYRSSRDGVNYQSFHKNCDNKGATIWIAKIKNSTKSIGGYNPLDWSGRGWKTTTDSFLFSFADWKNTSISTTKLSYINNYDGKFAIYCNNDCGPRMGDLECYDSDNWKYRGQVDYYPNLDIPNKFKIEDYEVFQVIKNNEN
ncbi:BTB/POZ domain-containing protein [Rhizophagus clarus]|uniref:BTB/POZ domain-containing protein n=1 Tax=Rhizophagus clarus TaxID=94130 RepID=A0A8H3KUS1_9GLOM|nr:BTB/POZ domain-containing protein [Rhizophagus clarus]